MKKLIKKSLFLIIVLMLFSQLILITSAKDNLIDSDEFAEILLLEEEVKMWINEALFSENLPTSSEIEIDFSKAFKLYLDTNVFKMNNNTEEILNELEKGDYMWVYPYSAHGIVIMVNISAGGPLIPEVKKNLTEEEQKVVIENEGKWGAQGCDIHYDPLTFLEKTAFIKDLNNDKTDYVLIGGLPGIRQPVAISYDDNKMVNVIMLNHISYDETEPKTILNQNIVFDFSEVAALSNKIKYTKGVIGCEDIYDKLLDPSLKEPPAENFWLFPVVILVTALGIIGYNIFNKAQKR